MADTHIKQPVHTAVMWQHNTLTRMYFMNTKSQTPFSGPNWHHQTRQTFVFTTAADEERQITVWTPEFRNDSTHTSWPEPSGSSIKLFCVFSIGNFCILILYSLNLQLTLHKKSRVCSVAPAAMCRNHLLCTSYYSHLPDEGIINFHRQNTLAEVNPHGNILSRHQTLF
jgi:hypothetical protein